MILGLVTYFGNIIILDVRAFCFNVFPIIDNIFLIVNVLIPIKRLPIQTSFLNLKIRH